MYQSQLIDALSEKSKALNEVLANLKKNGGNKTVSLKDGTQITGESGNNGFTFIIKRNNTVVKKQSYKSLPSTNTLQSDFKTALEASILGDAKIKQSAPAKQEAKPEAQPDKPMSKKERLFKETGAKSGDELKTARVLSDLRDILFRKSGTPPKGSELDIESDGAEIEKAINGRDVTLYMSVHRKTPDESGPKAHVENVNELERFAQKVVKTLKGLHYVKEAHVFSIAGGSLQRISFRIKHNFNPFGRK